MPTGLSDRTLVVPLSERVFLTTDQAGALLGISGRQVRRLVFAGEIRTTKIRTSTRIHRAELDRYAQTLWAQQHGLAEEGGLARSKRA